MDYSAAHAGFVIAAYALSAVVLALLLAAVIARARKLARKSGK